jgi:hypothetical protein
LIYRDADDAVKARDGYDYDGYRLRVEFPRGSGPGNLESRLDNSSSNLSNSQEATEAAKAIVIEDLDAITAMPEGHQVSHVTQ